MFLLSKMKFGTLLVCLAGIDTAVAICLFWPTTPPVVIQSVLDLGEVVEGTEVQPVLTIRNTTSQPIRCVGADEACGLGCFHAEDLPAVIPPYGELKVTLWFGAPSLNSLRERKAIGDRAENEMTFYFDAKGHARKPVKLTCKVIPKSEPGMIHKNS
ncbi:hypothetical protein Plim_3709 [Planctopirus limnophila DSM 3776]|uniref:DUF1573 domain-containing protein n=1 Tax=Planctopirus limnophila (strain ATCC 43296 / DSM 3776 / IFAM 1008 / Mu 290) TaxID=521674 RepID=D5SWC8_PLAL2|nr:hypothetical protein [Planctopirus limnophila]ADG69521.1 hypothetical protein Plim_3709 [Planctopirus limnophila DSM 3776]